MATYSRAYSNNSAGQLVSAKGLKGDPLSPMQLLSEFRNHAKLWNRTPTALVSASNRIVDTTKRAFDKHYVDGEPPVDIWIAFIQVPTTPHDAAARIHHAQQLAEDCGLSNSGSFRYEFVFEWGIPENFVVHKVSLQTLMDRGLEWKTYLFRSGPKLPLPTEELKARITTDIQPVSPCHGSWETGLYLGGFARKFGARAPLDWISHQLFFDCIGGEIDSDMENGIDTALLEWWLADTQFFLDYMYFKDRRDAMEESMLWDQIEFWETWHGVGGDGKPRQLSRVEEVLYAEAWDTLSGKHERIGAAIEAEAVTIGL
ncbi:hypothetical protein Micbo1qcDRAFT_154686 [Microdochium bolleyi]|uniref:Uncharacterized protein n=1 Tax=Microdochium bolleyi TaxID=196109 RepID=A0A136IIG1_9PEZI|nr:hypothetical protein Micbo1qcDRAFT_154686 [Microdochium bolleyi]